MNMLTGIEGFTLRLWTGVMGISFEEVVVTLAKVKKDPKIPRFTHICRCMLISLPADLRNSNSCRQVFSVRAKAREIMTAGHHFDICLQIWLIVL